MRVTIQPIILLSHYQPKMVSKHRAAPMTAHLSSICPHNRAALGPTHTTMCRRVGDAVPGVVCCVQLSCAVWPSCRSHCTALLQIARQRPCWSFGQNQWGCLGCKQLSFSLVKPYCSEHHTLLLTPHSSSSKMLSSRHAAVLPVESNSSWTRVRLNRHTPASNMRYIK